MTWDAMRETLQDLARVVATEQKDYHDVKARKAHAEDVVLRGIVAAVKPALPAISSQIKLGSGAVVRGVSLGNVFLSETGMFFVVNGSTGIALEVGIDEVLDRTTLVAITAVLCAALANQRGRLTGRTDEIKREAAVLEGIAAAFKAGGVK